MNKYPVVSFVIRTKDESKYIVETLKRITEQKEIKTEIILVDSGSTDGTIELAQPYIDRLVQIKAEEFTWGYALNKGIEVSTGRTVCLISGHCFLYDKYSVIKGYHILQNNKLAAVYGMQKGDLSKNPYEYLEMMDQYPNISCRVFTTNEIECFQSFGISNACSLINRDVWNKYKYDEYVQSSEDGLWALTVSRAGEKVAYTSEYSVIHAHQYNYQYAYKKNYWRMYCGIKGREYLIGNKVLLFLKQIVLRPIYYFAKDYKKIIKKGVRISKRKIYLYRLLNGLANYRAFLDARDKGDLSLKYEELELSQMAEVIGKWTVI